MVAAIKSVAWPRSNRNRWPRCIGICTLTDDERRSFRQIIQRVAALLALGPTLDALYQEAAAGAFTATELGIIR